MSSRTVLLIDYEPRSIEDTLRPLRNAGYHVEVAHDGVAGLEAFNRLHPDLVLVEAMLPKKHGFEVCQAIKGTPEGRTVPVLITTGVYRGRKYRSQAFTTYGCDEYLEKPISDEQLLAVCGKFLDEGATGSVDEPVVAINVDPATQAPPTEATSPTPAADREQPKSPLSLDELSDLTEEEIMGRLDALLADMGEAVDAAARDAGHAMPTPADETEADPGRIEPESSAAAEVEPGPAPEASAAAPITFDGIREEIAAELGRPAVAPVAEDPVPEVEEAPAEGFDPEPAGEPEPVLLSASDTVAIPRPVVAEPRVEAPRPRAAAVPVIEHVTVPPPAKTSRGVPMWVWGAVAVALAGGGVAAWLTLAPGPDAVATSTAPRSETDARSVPVVPDVPVETEAVPEAATSDARETPAAKTAAAPEPVASREPEPSPAKTVEVAAAEPARPPVHEATAPVRLAPEPAPRTAAPKPEPPAPKPEPPAPKPAAAATSIPEASTKAVETPARPASQTATSGPAVERGDAATPENSVAPPPAVEPEVARQPAAAEPVPEPPKPRTKRGDLVPIGDVDVPPIEVRRPAPSYPPIARQMGQQGTVVLNVLVDETGKVAQVDLLRGIDGTQLNDAAIRAVRNWTYKPAKKDDVAVKVWKTVSISFSL